MSEMIERVAKGMCRAAIIRPAIFMYSPEGVEYHVANRWREWVDHSRAAIEAMHEPTEAMKDAGVGAEHTLEAMSHISHGQSCANIFTAMIDEALKP